MRFVVLHVLWAWLQLSDAGGTATLSATFAPVELPNTHRRVLQSETNGVTYALQVSLPKDHGRSDREYPVVLLLDADYSFAIARNIVEHLSDRGDLEPAVLVGIAYDGPPAYRMHRTRDYTPMHAPDGGYGPEYQAVSGGGPGFLAFIEGQLVPFLEREYRTTSRRTIVGHSYGGLFASWVLLTRPELFAGYVIVSPSLWYHDRAMFALAERTASGDLRSPTRVYLTVGDREGNSERDMVGDVRAFAEVVGSRHPRGLELRWEVAEGETHNSVFPRALGTGLRFVLGGR